MSAPLVVHTARGYLPDGRTAVLEDWPDAATAQQALARVLSWPWPHAAYAPDFLDILADGLAVRLGVDVSRPYGCALRIEP